MKAVVSKGGSTKLSHFLFGSMHPSVKEDDETPIRASDRSIDSENDVHLATECSFVSFQMEGERAAMC